VIALVINKNLVVVKSGGAANIALLVVGNTDITLPEMSLRIVQQELDFTGDGGIEFFFDLQQVFLCTAR